MLIMMIILFYMKLEVADVNHIFILNRCQQFIYLGSRFLLHGRSDVRVGIQGQ